MKILDNTALSFAVQEKVKLRDQYYVTPDVRDEQLAWGRDALPDKVSLFTDRSELDEGIYLQYYQAVLNKYKAVSFYNMRGFGDISIIALLHTIKRSGEGQLPGLGEVVTVVTSDRTLRQHIATDFSDASSSFDQSLVVVGETEHFAD